jgi:F420-non-reducing hydrogenase small subunit
MLRQKSQLVLAFGSCSHLGGIPGLANLWERESIFQTVYHETPSTVNPDGVIPKTKFGHNGDTVHLPGFYDTVKSLNQVIDVDYYIPGCAPTPKIIAAGLEALLTGNVPAKGSVLSPDHALCEECPRRESRPEKLTLTSFKRPHEILIDEEICLMAQGLVCMGPATRAGCEAVCIQGNMPCTGCFGPTSRIKDQGGKFMSSLASILECEDEDAIEGVLDSIPDPVGTLYRYSLPASILRRKKL